LTRVESSSVLPSPLLARIELKERIIGKLKFWDSRYDLKTKNWHERSISVLTACEASLDAKIPNWCLQNKIDKICSDLKQKLAPLAKWNAWLDQNGEGKWYVKMAIFLAKLPLRVARNFIDLLYKILKEIFYFLVHPLKSILRLSKLFVDLCYKMTRTETLSHVGNAVMGASIGYFALSGNLLTLIGVATGGAMLLVGLGMNTLKAAIHAEVGKRQAAAKEAFFNQGKQIPEMVLTGFVAGLLLGQIHRTVEVSPDRTFLIQTDISISAQIPALNKIKV
jgi:hypothetical protein